MRRAAQMSLPFRAWGGRRAGAGRPPRPGRPRVSHHRRPAHDPRMPVHVTLRATRGLPSLRGSAVFAAVRSSLAVSSGTRFRILQFSVQMDHLHLLVEAESTEGLARGCQGLGVRIARAVNRILGRRGTVWGDRYYARALSTPAEVRRALVYVLQNFRKHEPGA